MDQSVLLFLLVTFSFHPKKGTTLASPTGNLPGKYSNREVALGQGFFQILMWQYLVRVFLTERSIVWQSLNFVQHL